MTTPCRTRTADGGTGPQDLLLVQGALAGDPAAVDGLVQRLSCVVRFVFRLNQTLGYRLATESLEDVVQQVHAALWPRLADYTGAAALETWVFGFCRNCLRAEARRRWSAGSTDALDAARSDDPDPVQEAERAEGVDRLHAELDRLSPVEREAVSLRHLEGWSFEEIGRRQGLAASTIKDRCYRAMCRLKERLGRSQGGMR